MASQKVIVPAGTSVKIATVGNDEFILLPVGDTVFTNPVTPTPVQVYTVTYTVETEVEYSLDKVLKDANGKTFADYIGGRPTR